jgi:predicted Zn-dependent protease
VAEKVGKIDERLSALDGSLKSVKDDLGELSGEVKKRAEAPAAKPAEVAAADETATTIGQGAELFKAGKYKEAADVFKKLESANVKDARVYYYAALLKGLNTANWQGETVTTGEKGAELEKAGSPKPADVDAAFADLPATLKPWLTFFRKKAK